MNELKLTDDSLIFDLGDNIYGEIKDVYYNTKTKRINYMSDLYSSSEKTKSLPDEEKEKYLDILNERFKNYISSSLQQLLSLRS